MGVDCNVDKIQASKRHLYLDTSIQREVHKRGSIFLLGNLTSINRGTKCDLEFEADASQSPAIFVVYRHLKRISTLFQ